MLAQSKIERGVVLSVAAFGFFLVASAPHRVHHFFENQRHSHDQARANNAEHDHDHDRPSLPTPCVILAVSQNCQLGQAETVELSFLFSVIEATDSPSIPWRDPFTFTVFFQRAPPITAFQS
jgi:hypothetical protein